MSLPAYLTIGLAALIGLVWGGGLVLLNPLLKRLGWQEPDTPHPVATELAKVIEVQGTKIRVAFEGTTWFAKTIIEGEKIEVGDWLKVCGRDGLTLLLEIRKSC